MNDIVIAVVLGVVGIVFFGISFFVALSRFYKKVNQGEALIINKWSSTVVSQEGGWVIPVVDRAEIMDISVKRIDIDRRGKNGLICRDFLRADINVNFFVRVNSQKEEILEVAQTIGCRRASDLAALETLFTAKFAEALKTAGKKFDFADLFSNRDGFRDTIKEVIGQDLNGFVLEDVAIDYLEQTDLQHLNPNDVNDAIGIEKIVRVTKEKQVVEATLSNEAEAAIASENVKKCERIKQAEKETAEIEERTLLAKETARIYRERQVEEQELTKNKEIEIIRRKDEAEILAAEQEKLRRAEIAQKDRERAVLLKDEENLRLKMEEQMRRREQEAVLEIQKQKKAEEETALLKEAEGRKLEAEERNQTIQVVEEAKREAESKVINAEAEAKEARIKEEQAAEAKKKVAEIDAQASKSHLVQVETQAEATKRTAEADAFSKERLADAEAKQYAAKEIAKVQVERDREDLRKLRISNDDEEGKITALNQQRTGEAQASIIRDEGVAKAEVDERILSVKERENTVDAERIRQVGLAEAEASRQVKFAEAEGMSKLAEAQKLFDSISQNREEFRLQLEKRTEIALAQIGVRKDIAQAQAGVMSEAFKQSDIKIVGGDGRFFDQFIQAVSLGQSIDGALESSSTLRTVAKDYLEGESSLVHDLRDVLASPNLSASNLRDISLTALLSKLAGQSDGERKGKIENLLKAAEKLGLGE
jgi:uncharacterized membrane protein YqiK